MINSNEKIAQRKQGIWQKHALWIFVPVLVLMCGCMWTRLWTFKMQLVHFEQYATVKQSDGYIIHFRKPVLVPSDVRLFIPLEASSKSTDGSTENWNWIFKKQSPGTSEGTNNFDLHFNIEFEGGLFSSLKLPVQFTGVLPKQSVIGLFYSVGRAEVDRDNRLAKTSWKDGYRNNMELPAMTQIRASLGIPFLVKTNGATQVWTYCYYQDTPEVASPAARLAWVSFSFEGNRMESSKGGIGSISWELTALKHKGADIQLRFRRPNAEFVPLSGLNRQ